MDIKAYIRELLFGHECVIIPGFGGFIGNYTPSRIDGSTGTFYPPVTKISFNRNLNHNDGLLISKISRSRGLHYGDARHMVEVFVRDLNSKLARGEKVFFDHLGTFALNHEMSVQFEPEVNINYHLASYGLESFQCHPVSGYDARKRITRHIDRDSVRQLSKGRKLWKAAIAIPILALIVIVPLKTSRFKSNVESSGMNPLVKAEFENNKRAVDEETNLASDTNIIVNPVETKPKTEAPVKPSEKNIYGVITGSFKSEENALSHVDVLKLQGYKPEIIPASNGFYRVVAMYCNDLEIAIEKKDSISKQFPGTWVSKR
jgi:nucleoid DNA-binding protein